MDYDDLEVGFDRKYYCYYFLFLFYFLFIEISILF